MQAESLFFRGRAAHGGAESSPAEAAGAAHPDSGTDSGDEGDESSTSDDSDSESDSGEGAEEDGSGNEEDSSGNEEDISGDDCEDAEEDRSGSEEDSSGEEKESPETEAGERPGGGQGDPVSRLGDAAEDGARPGQLWCSKCRTNKCRDSFSAQQRRADVSDSDRSRRALALAVTFQISRYRRNVALHVLAVQI